MCLSVSLDERMRLEITNCFIVSTTRRSPLSLASSLRITPKAPSTHSPHLQKNDAGSLEYQNKLDIMVHIVHMSRFAVEIENTSPPLSYNIYIPLFRDFFYFLLFLPFPAEQSAHK